jgi:hypothetical protein
MEKLWIVCWGSGSCDDHGSAHAYSGVHGIYQTKESARKALEQCKDEMYSDIVNDLDPDGEFPECKEEIQVYGSVSEGYFEIDYTLGTEPVEVYINLVESSVNE